MKTQPWTPALIGALLFAGCQDDSVPSYPGTSLATIGFADSLLVVDEGDETQVHLWRADSRSMLSVEVVATAPSTADTSDFSLPSEPVEFQPGEVQATLSVRTTRDPFDEPNEEIVLGILSLENADAPGTQETCRIRIRDAGPQPILSWSERTPLFVEESDHLRVLYIEGSQLSETEEISVRQTGGTAREEYDFRMFVLHAPGPNRRGVVYLSLLEDGADEEDESLTLELVPEAPDVFIAEPEVTFTIVEESEPSEPTDPIWFPLEPGNVWDYAKWLWTFNEIPDYTEFTESVLETRSVDGETVAIVSDDGRRWSGYRQEGQVVYEYSGQHGVPEGKDDFEVRRFFDFLTSDERWEFVNVDTVLAGQLYRRHEWMENLGRVAVGTPAGIFRNVHAFSFHKELRDDSLSQRETSTTTYYVADGIGIVEIRRSYQGRDFESRSRTELRSWP